MNKTAKKLIGAGALIAAITAFTIPALTGQAAGSKSTAHHSTLSSGSVQTTAAAAGLKDGTVRDVTSDCWNDIDGDGICDNCQTVHEDGACSDWADSNNDGICDNHGSGCGNSQGNTQSSGHHNTQSGGHGHNGGHGHCGR